MQYNNLQKSGSQENRMLQQNRRTVKLKKGAGRNSGVPKKHKIIGIGLVALDIVCASNNSEVQFYAGGTCGNVITILSCLGWDAAPVARLGKDINSEIVASDMKEWGVDEEFLRLSPFSNT